MVDKPLIMHLVLLVTIVFLNMIRPVFISQHECHCQLLEYLGHLKVRLSKSYK